MVVECIFDVSIKNFILIIYCINQVLYANYKADYTQVM